MANPRYCDWSSDPASTTHRSQSSIERIVWTDDDDHDRIDQKKTFFAWYWCFRCCIVGSLLAGIGLAIVLTFWLTSKTVATETLIVTTSFTNSSSSLSVSTSIATSSNTPSALTSISTSSNTPSTTKSPSSSSLTTEYTVIILVAETTTTTSPSTTSFFCSSTPPQSLAEYETDTVTNWTQYIYNYTSTTTFPILIFGVDASPEMYIMIDDVSVVDITSTSVELLENSDFENSSTTLTGWSVWCTSTCNSGDGGIIYTSNCRLSSNCYKSQCRGSIDYLVQSFSTVIGRIYTISFWFQRLRSSSSGGSAKLYVGII
ncbi:unnamed protein product [Adineta steineri]|uniref:Uncharacterized protein n=1 Tax=Adineta steineri TaxID=433720 RepID=A0A815NHS6_9BILA|nr:unnamed protein product [Adineta steineri]